MIPVRQKLQKISWLGAGGLLAGIVIVALSQTVQAGPITNGPNRAPFTKLGVYGGVLTVVNGGQVLELGNAGRDIGSTADIYLRPGSLSAANGARVFKNGTVADLLVTGNLCLYPGGIPDCRSVWPSGGGGDYWQETAAPVRLKPKVSGQTLGIGDSGNRVTALPALDIQTTSWQALNVSNTNLGANAIRTDGDVYFQFDTAVERAIKVDGVEVWHDGGFSVSPNQGLGSGLDADRLEQQNVTLEPAIVCQGVAPTCSFGQPTLACLCITTAGGRQCAPMCNRS